MNPPSRFPHVVGRPPLIPQRCCNNYFKVLPGGEQPKTRLSGSRLLWTCAKADPWSMVQKLQTVLSKSRCSQVVLDQCQPPTSPGERQHHNPPTQATMSADPLQALASAGQGKSTRSLLRVIILALIAAAAIASRLFSVIRTCPVSRGPFLVVMVSWSSDGRICNPKTPQSPEKSIFGAHSRLTKSSPCRIREHYP
jgi:hypothetical protein